ncbi:unnamed protein product [Mucor hiemalis]
MKSVNLKSTQNKQKTTIKKSQSFDGLDKENIPPSVSAHCKTQAQSVASKKSKRITSFNRATTKTTAKVRKSDANMNKKKKANRLYQIRNYDADKDTKSKIQEEGERKSHNIVSPTITSNVDSISRRLKDNMTKATYNMMACLVLSNEPCDHYLYEKLFKSLNASSTRPHSENNKNYESHMEMFVYDPSAENHAINVSSLTQLYGEGDPIFNGSFDMDQEDAFINAWLQHGSGGGTYSSSCFDANDDFSIVTEQELSELLLRDEAFL